MPDLFTVFLLTPLVVFLCYWAWFTFVFTAGAVLLSDAESVTDGVATALDAFPVAVALALVTMLEFFSGQEFLGTNSAE